MLWRTALTLSVWFTGWGALYAQQSGACKTITYEGLAEKVPIPAFDGISSPGWVAGISVIAYGLPLGDPTGGHAQFINEPSPVTAAVFLNGSNDITFASPVSSVQYYYATGYSTLLTAYDVNNNILVQESVPSNWSGNPNGYDVWTQIAPLQAPAGTQIARINILSSGPPLNNFFAIDNLKVCTAIAIDSVEMTQAIQQIQALADLKASLANTNEPPVPIISGKPGVMRIYLKPVAQTALVNVQLDIAGLPEQAKTATAVPGCSPTQQRYGSNGCLSTDFYFTPPSGAWTATLELIDPGTGSLLEEEVLNFKSRDTQALRLEAVSTCDAVDDSGNWLCADASDLQGKETLLAKIAPTNSVTVDVTDQVIRRDVSQLGPPFPPGDDVNDYWWDLVTADLGRMYGFVDSGQDLFYNRHSTFHGMVRPELPGGTGGQADAIPGRGEASRTSALRFASNTETNVEVVAHETGHSLGLKHTNEISPANNTAPPGCYNFASDSSTDWPFATNNIQSTDNLEVGFDVALRTPIDPNVTYDVMSYCSPRWISPQRYKTLITTLGGGSGFQPSTVQAMSVVTEAFWMVSGTIPGTGAPQFDPIFSQTVQGDTSGGSGAYSLEVQNTGGTALFTQHFTPGTPATETTGTDYQGYPGFAQLIPVTAGAARIVLKDPTSTVLGTVTLGGVAPTVHITNPTAGFTGVGNISWTITDPDSSSFDSRVFYSPDNGAHYSEIGEVRNSGTTLLADFTKLAGSNGQGLIKVLVSDGVNTGRAISTNFSIPKKVPSLVQITAPAANSSQPAADAVLFTGTAFDPDDGALTGAALKWSSSLQGALGTGSPLSAVLQPGAHTITLTATDSDGNSVSSNETVTVGGQPPVLNLSLKTLGAPPATSTTCIQATIGATTGVNGAPLSSVQYSLNGGGNYTAVSLSSLPFTFTVPGSGFVNMVARATDKSNQSNAQGSSFFIGNACQAATVPNVVGATLAAAQTAISAAQLVIGNITTAASSTVPAGNIISENPTAGTIVPPGSSASVNLLFSTGTGAVTVPNVVGTTQAAATMAIQAAGLAVGTVSKASSSTVASGSVISESPVAGTSVSVGSAVNLTISTGPAKVAVPNVVGATQAAATTAITGAGLVVGTVTTASSSTVPSGNVISESPVAGTQVNVGSAVNLVVSSGAGGTPAVVSVTPNAATGLSNTFALVYSDTGGNASLNHVGVIFNPVATAVSSCYVLYYPATNLVYLLNNAGSASTKLTPGSGTLSNSQCTVSGSGITVVKSGNNLTLNLAVTASSTYTGKQSIFMYADDNTAVNTGWVGKGTWTPAANQAPALVSVTPTPATGLTNTFSLTYSDPNGASDLNLVKVIFGPTASVARSCYVLYYPGSNLLYLENTAGTGTVNPSSGILSNTQCSINGNTSTVGKSGDNVTINLVVTASSTYTGKQSIFMYAADNSGANTGFVAKGTWTPAANQAPKVVSVTPTPATGVANTFALTFSDPNGASDLNVLKVDFGTAVSASNSCYVLYYPGTNLLYLENDAGTATTKITPGSGTLSNSQCTISGIGTTVVRSGDNITLNLAVTASATYTAKVSIFLSDVDNSTATSGWTNKGTWTP